MIKNEYRISKFLTLEFVCHMWQIDTHSYFFLGDKKGTGLSYVVDGYTQLFRFG